MLHFKSYRVYAVEELTSLTEADNQAVAVGDFAKQSAVVRIESISTPDEHTAVKTLTLTSTDVHLLTSQSTYGYLHGLTDKTEQTAFKVFTVKDSPPTFDIKLANRTDIGDLKDINSSIASGRRIVQFR